MASSTTRSHLLPQGAYDTHVHVFDSRLGPYDPNRAYTPAEAPLTDLLQFASSISDDGKPQNVVIVQPSPYKNDNRVLMAVLSQLQEAGFSNSRGIAVFDPTVTTDDELQSMHNLGVRGLRLNVQADGKKVNFDALREALVLGAERIKKLAGWRLQIYAPAEAWDALYETILKLPVEVIADHIGGLKGLSKQPELRAAGDVLTQSGLGSIVRLAQQGCLIVKLSGFYRASASVETGYDDLAPIVRHLAQKAPGRLIWASDWPHTGEGKIRSPETALTQIEGFRTVDNVAILKRLRSWLEEEDTWQQVMVNNPKTFYH